VSECVSLCVLDLKPNDRTSLSIARPKHIEVCWVDVGCKSACRIRSPINCNSRRIGCCQAFRVTWEDFNSERNSQRILAIHWVKHKEEIDFSETVSIRHSHREAVVNCSTVNTLRIAWFRIGKILQFRARSFNTIPLELATSVVDVFD